MKLSTTNTTTLFALFLLSALTSLLPSTTAQITVFDIDGNPLRNGGTYYILPAASSGMGGGIESAKTGSETCPLTIVQSPNEHSVGLPIKISSRYRIYSIQFNLPLDLSFASPPSCAPTPSKWIIERANSQGQRFVKLDKADRAKGSFYIDKYGSAYMLAYCSISESICSDTGIHIDSEGNRRLVLTYKNPLVVQFKLASSSAA